MVNHLFLPWNIVARNFTPREELKQWVQREIKKLERHLTNFPHESVHLHVDFEYHKKTKKFTSSLTLRLPSNLLNSKAIDDEPISALAQATKALIREVDKLKDDLRHVKDRHRIREKIESSGQKSIEERPVAFAPQPLPEDRAPRDVADLLKHVIEDNYQRLFDYVKRQIDYLESTGEIPKNSIDAEAALDEVVKQALEKSEAKSDELGYVQWIYQLINEELNKRHRMLKERQKVVPVEEMEEEAVDSDEIAPLIASMLNEPPEEEISAQSKIIVPSRTLPPDKEIAEKEFVEELLESSHSWDKLEKDVFELHFIEGFNVEDCAMILKRDLSELQKAISNVHERIRQKILAEMWTK